MSQLLRTYREPVCFGLHAAQNDTTLAETEQIGSLKLMLTGPNFSENLTLTLKLITLII